MITLSRLVAAIRRLASRDPDFVYYTGRDGCAYAPSTHRPCGCIVGEALQMLGVPVEALADLDRLADRFVDVRWGSSAVRKELADWVTEEALGSDWVVLVQRLQDSGMRTWSDAVRIADSEAGVLT